MSQYVWAHANVLIADGRFHTRLTPGMVFWADDPVVEAHPDMFSAAPLEVHSTTGRPQPGIVPVAPLTAPEPGDTPGEVEPDDAQPQPVVLAATEQPAKLAETDPTVAAVVTADRRRGRRG